MGSLLCYNPLEFGEKVAQFKAAVFSQLSKTSEDFFLRELLQGPLTEFRGQRNPLPSLTGNLPVHNLVASVIVHGLTPNSLNVGSPLRICLTFFDNTSTDAIDKDEMQPRIFNRQE